MIDPAFWRGRRVFLTGHTGFKGAWTALWLETLGADVHGFALPPATSPALCQLTGAGLALGETIADLRDAERLQDAVNRIRPQVVLHLAAQAIVRRSYDQPRETFETNLMGTVNLLDALRTVEDLEAAVIATTDKVYENPEAGHAFSEVDKLGGEDPYSASKAAAEIAALAYAKSFFGSRAAIATARAGNVIGGGDWAEDRLVPDLVRALEKNETLVLRNPRSVRPWLHVLDVIAGYFALFQYLTTGKGPVRAFNFAPASSDRLTVAALAETVAKTLGKPLAWREEPSPEKPEKGILLLDASLAERELGWSPRLSQATAVEWTAGWYASYLAGRDVGEASRRQIDDFSRLA